jgi:hypothetical protein
MPVELSPKQFRGVICRHCGKPVRIPTIVQRKDSELHGHHHASPPINDDGHFQLVSRVFVLRCRSCERESIYAMDEIVDCFYSPPAAFGRLAHAAAT